MMKVFPTVSTVGVCLVALAFSVQTPTRAQDVGLCVSERFADQVADAVAQQDGASMIRFGDHAQLVERVGQCDAVIAMAPTGLDEVLRAGSRLRWLQTASAGVERLVSSDELVASDIVLTNAKILQGPEIADHAFALLLNLTRDVRFFNEQVTWNRENRLPIIELRGKTALIIGLGGIGTQIAQRAAAFEMRVIAVDPKDIPMTRDVAYVGTPDQLDELLPQADVVFSSVPHTPASRGMLGEEQFALMKDGVYVVNVSRGPIIDTDALVAALRSGKVRAAGLDVVDPEPLPDGHPLWSMPNVAITPHIATLSDHSIERRVILFRENIERFLNGRPLRNVVDKKLGY